MENLILPQYTLIFISIINVLSLTGWIGVSVEVAEEVNGLISHQPAPCLISGVLVGVLSGEWVKLKKKKNEIKKPKSTLLADNTRGLRN